MAKRVSNNHRLLGLTLALTVGLGLMAVYSESGLAATAKVGKSLPRQASSKKKSGLAQSGAKKALKASSSKKTISKLPEPDYLRTGIATYKKGYVAKAIPFFQQATRRNPQDMTAWLWLARCYRKQGKPADYANAATVYDRVLKSQPEQVEALSNLGEYWSWNPARRAEAIDLLRRAYSLAPNSVEVNRRLAEALFWNNNSAQALPYAELVTPSSRDDKKWMGEYAQILAASGRLDEAIQIHQTVLVGEDTRDPSSKMELARILYAQNQPDKAQNLFNEIRQTFNKQPNSMAKPEMALKLSALAYDLGLPADSLALDEGLPDALLHREEVQLRRARALGRVSRAPEAIEAWNRLYEAQLLTAEQKVEFADYLRTLGMTTAGSSPNLVDTLYQEAAAQSAGQSGSSALSLARRFAQGDTDGKHFAETVQSFRQAIAAAPDATAQATVRHELLDYLKSDKTHPQEVEAQFKDLLAEQPTPLEARMAYAEYVSWQVDRRPEALRLYVDLAKTTPGEDTENRTLWQARIDEVLKWHQPSTALIPLYQQIVDLYPQDVAIRKAVARAYRSDPKYYKEAVAAYADFVGHTPDDATMKKEWLDLLVGNPGQRDENIRYLKGMLDNTPAGEVPDPDVQATYAKLLSYDHKYGPAMEIFEKVLKTRPNHREALLGKGYVLLWEGKKLEGKRFFTNLHQKFPDDVDVAIGLAQANKLLGRYDEALRLMKDIHPAEDPSQSPQSGENKKSFVSSQPHLASSGDYQWVSHWRLAPLNLLEQGATVSDYSVGPSPGQNLLAVDPVSQGPPVPGGALSIDSMTQAGQSSATEPTSSDRQPQGQLQQSGHKPLVQLPAKTGNLPKSHPVKSAASTKLVSPPSAVKIPKAGQLLGKPVSLSSPAVTDKQINDLQSDIDVLSDAVKTIKLLQDSSAAQLRQLDQNLNSAREAVPDEMPLQDNRGRGGSVAGLYGSVDGSGDGAGQSGSGNYIGEGGMVPRYGAYAALDYDTNPLLSGLGRFRNDDLTDLEKGVTNDLRPMFRVGYQYFRQGGNDTTNRMSGSGFPNQIAVSLTPQLRVRGGVQPTRWYMPRGVSPSLTWGTQYGMGATYKPTDRLTLDGDIALTYFSQSNSSNLTFQAQAQYDFNDSVRGKIGVRRMPQYNSMLTLTGLRPGQGAYSGALLGQARENGIYGELNTHPFNPNWDWNLGYEWAFIDGSNIPSNRKNQAFTSLGYTWHYGERQQVRLGYEMLYFGYAKNATNGFFDTTANGFRDPVVNLRPVTAANGNYVFGGYYSPTFFLMNAARLDFRGSLFDRFLEYKIGGSMGIQTARLGHYIRESGNGSSLSSSMDANLILNFTDWLAAYGDVDFLNAGGQFNRWRFGGGLIVRPKIDALSPVFGKGSHPRANSGKPDKMVPVSSTQSGRISPVPAVDNSIIPTGLPNGVSMPIDMTEPAPSSSTGFGSSSLPNNPGMVSP